MCFLFPMFHTFLVSPVELIAQLEPSPDDLSLCTEEESTVSTPNEGMHEVMRQDYECMYLIITSKI